MRLAQARAIAEKESKESGCTVHLCASLIFSIPDNDQWYDARVDPMGYRTCDFYDSSVIASCTNGKWRTP